VLRIVAKYTGFGHGDGPNCPRG